MSFKDRLHALHRRLADPQAGGTGPLPGPCSPYGEPHGDCQAARRAARCRLAACAAVYGAAVRRRNRAYDEGRREVVRAGVPVISIGNITAGGTGKTPMAAHLACLLRDRGRRPAILSRGYGRDPRSGLDDENRMLARLAPGVPLVVRLDRAAGAREAVERLGADVLLLDDGFQHRRLARDLDVVLIDALMPFGGGRLLPLGWLREPLDGLARAGAFVITRSDLADAECLDAIRSQLRRHAPDAPVALAVHRPVGARLLAGGAGGGVALDSLAGGRWGAFCGIGNPEGFRGTLRALGVEPVPFRAFPDHHRYGPDELAGLIEAAARDGLSGLLTTEKDEEKVLAALPAQVAVPVVALAVRMELTEGGESLAGLVFRLAEPRMEADNEETTAGTRGKEAKPWNRG